MKITITRIAGVASLVFGMALTSHGQIAEKMSLEAGADIMSHYVWRGQLLTDDPVVQPSVTLGLEPVSLNVWGSIDTTNVNESDMDDDWRMQEVDYTASSGFSPMEGLDLEGGVIYYTFAGLDGTTELYGSLALSSLPLTPTLTLYFDVDEAKGTYATLAVGHSFGLTEKLSLDLGASLGWGDQDYHMFYGGGKEQGLSDASVSAGLGYTVNDTMSLSLTLTYSDFVDSDISDNMKATWGDPDVFFGGVGIAFSF